MRIKKTSATTTISAQVVNTPSNSETDTYSCNYINGVQAFSGNESGTVTLTENTSNYSNIEIIATNADGHYFSSGKLPITENMIISLLSHSFRDNGETFIMWPSSLKLTNNTLVPQTSKWVYRNADGTLGYGSGNYINVQKVYLYK